MVVDVPSFDDEMEEVEYEQEPYEYELVVIDADTPIVRAAKLVQEDYVLVTHTPTGKVKEFKNKTQFYGHWVKKSGGWLAEVNEERVNKNKKPFLVEEFEIEECSRLLEGMDHLSEGVKLFDFFVGGIKAEDYAPDYLLCIDGGGNYRYDEAHIIPYKGNRLEKPLLFAEIKEAILDKYQTKIETVENVEVDDRLAYYGAENVKHHKKTGKWKYLLAYVDKDLDNIVSPSVNYDKLEEGITEANEVESARSFCTQLLCGDKSVDNIQGLPAFAPEIQEKYSLRKSKGIGKQGAINYLSSCETIKQLFERVVEAYRAYYGEDEFDFESFRGETFKRTWVDMLQENAMLLRMAPEKDPTKWHITKTLNKLKVGYK